MHRELRSRSLVFLRALLALNGAPMLVLCGALTAGVGCRAEPPYAAPDASGAGEVSAGSAAALPSAGAPSAGAPSEPTAGATAVPQPPRAGMPGGGMAGLAAPSGGAAAVSGMMAAANGGSDARAGGAAPRGPIPVLRDGKYQLEFGSTLFEIDPRVGARVTKFAMAGQNILTGPDTDAGNWGSTFWPSPQQRWNWPPIPELDNQPFEAVVTGDQLVLSSADGARAKVRVEKRVRFDATREAVQLDYQLTNTDSAPVAWAGWEVSRVAAGGLSFFRTGERSVTRALPVMETPGVTWYRHEPGLVGSGLKFTADGRAGWLAHVAGKLLFLKTFDDVPVAKQAPAPEAEIGIYAAAGYVELEPQGAYTQLMPGQRVNFRVRWLVRTIPDSVEIAVGSAELVAFAEALAAP